MLPRVRAVTRLSRRVTAVADTMKHRETSPKSGRNERGLAATAIRQLSVTAGDPADLPRAWGSSTAMARRLSDGGKSRTRKYGYYAAIGTYPCLSDRPFGTHRAIVLAAFHSTASHHRAVSSLPRVAPFRGDATQHVPLREAVRIGQTAPSDDPHAPPSASPAAVGVPAASESSSNQTPTTCPCPQVGAQTRAPARTTALPTSRYCETLGGPWLR